MKLYTLVVTSILVCFSISIPNKAYSQKAAGWVYMYSFDGNAYDVGPNRNHGEIVGSVNSVADRFGRANKALNFTTSDGYIRIPFERPLNLPVSNVTFTIWLYIDKYPSNSFWPEVNTSNYAPVFTKAEKSSIFQYRFGTTDKGFYFDGGQEGNSKGVYTKNLALTAGKWNMVSVSYNGYVMKLFLNDKIIATSNVGTAFFENQEPLIIGCDLPGGANYFSGKMDDLSIWEKFLTEDDVKQIYSVQSKYPFVPPNITVPIKPIVAVVKEDSIKRVIDTVKTITPIIPPVKSKPVIFEVSKGSTIVLQHVLFEQSKAELLPDSYTELDKLLETLIEYPQMIIEVSGHTDNQGSRDLNVILSEERAVKVKQYLVNHGIDAKRISTKGYGPDQPISPNNTEDNRKLNRRVEFKIIQM